LCLTLQQMESCSVLCYLKLVDGGGGSLLANWPMAAQRLSLCWPDRRWVWTWSSTHFWFSPGCVWYWISSLMPVLNYLSFLQTGSVSLHIAIIWRWRNDNISKSFFSIFFNAKTWSCGPSFDFLSSCEGNWVHDNCSN
jgi:hypothetical protein